VSATKSGTSVTYTYDALGRKMRSVGAQFPGQTRDYVGAFEYTGGMLDRIHTEAGYITMSGAVPTYHYYLRDHLGNVRSVLTPSGSSFTVIEQQDYYPYGMRKSLAGPTQNLYLYNGKEIQGELGGQYDFGARMLDPVIGRWNVVDPLAEVMPSWSPYAYGFDNPIRFIDPDGRHPRRTDPPGWLQNAYNAWTRLVTGTSGSSANSAIPNASPQTRSINRPLGTASDVKEIGDATVSASKVVAVQTGKLTGEGLEITGTVVSGVGYVAAPFTGGASLSMVPIGTAIQQTGSIINTTINIGQGEYADAAYSIGTGLVFGSVGKIIDKAEVTKTITKTDWGILSFFNDTWSKIADFIYDESKKTKE